MSPTCPTLSLRPKHLAPTPASVTEWQIVGATLREWLKGGREQR
jgi:hypothetical protein